MTLQLSDRINRIEMNPIIRLMGEVATLKRQGVRISNFSVGEPDFDTPEHIRQAAARAIEAGQTRYTPTDGTAALKEAVATKFLRENGLRFKANEIAVSSGAKQSIYNAFQCTLNAGDEVIIPAPYWTSYPEVVRLCDGVPRIVDCGMDTGFKIAPEQLEAAITARTRWFVLNTPSNPTGAVYDAAELRALAAVLERHPQVLVMADEIYEHLHYGQNAPASVAALAPSLLDRTLTINGVSKAYAMTGWRIGYAGGPAELIKAMAAIQSQATSNPCSISQAAALAALSGPQDLVASWREAYRRRRDLMVERLRAIKGLTCNVPDGAFYCYVGCASLLGRKDAQGRELRNDTDVAVALLQDAHVAVVQGAGFGLSPFLRFSYAASTEDIEEGCSRLAAYVGRIA